MFTQACECRLGVVLDESFEVEGVKAVDAQQQDVTDRGILIVLSRQDDVQPSGADDCCESDRGEACSASHGCLPTKALNRLEHHPHAELHLARAAESRG